jgi:hypothetical protein
MQRRRSIRPHLAIRTQDRTTIQGQPMTHLKVWQNSHTWGRHQQIRTTLTMKSRADQIRGMLATTHSTKSSVLHPPATSQSMFLPYCQRTADLLTIDDSINWFAYTSRDPDGQHPLLESWSEQITYLTADHCSTYYCSWITVTCCQGPGPFLQSREGPTLSSWTTSIK